MINLTFVHPDTGLDVVWPVNVETHSPFLEKRSTAEANAGDYIEPDVIYKGSYDSASLSTNPLPASEIATFYLFREASKKGRVFEVQGSVVALVGSDYTAYRTGDLIPKELHGGRYFTFTMKMRVTGIIEP